MKFIPEALHDLRNRVFLPAGHDLRLVGGAVRDWLDGQEPHDFDLATDASPDEQMALYAQHGIQHVPTGLQHGTVTVIFDHVGHEITSLRTESDHDGRHAAMTWTRDWNEDLARRDLTFNAMAMTFDGVLIDPFDGAADLAARRVRFVGDPEQRMREDYLRILRWLRFHGRVNPLGDLDEAAVEAVGRVKQGLKGISRERVWSEMSRIMAGEWGTLMFGHVISLELGEVIDLPAGSHMDFASAHLGSRDPAALMAAYLDGDQTAIEALASVWKWSTEERQRAIFIGRHLRHRSRDFDPKALIARDGYRKDWVVGALRLRGNAHFAAKIDGWPVPTFPVTGADLMALGIKPGPVMGQTLASLRALWAENQYPTEKQWLLDKIRTNGTP